MVNDADLDAAWLRANLFPLLAEPGKREAMGVAAAAFGRLDADRELADLVRRAVSGI
jgi:UDP-N-acetylglucosamine--N-acetylmuramyl-(pentapeptide) pyrophosphoryl-undecaprenol N-acetylglucosamine transferase